MRHSGQSKSGWGLWKLRNVWKTCPAGSRKNRVCGCLQEKIHEFVWRRKGQISEQAGLVRGKSTDGLSTRNHLCCTIYIVSVLPFAILAMSKYNYWFMHKFGSVTSAAPFFLDICRLNFGTFSVQTTIVKKVKVFRGNHWLSITNSIQCEATIYAKYNTQLQWNKLLTIMTLVLRCQK